MEERKLEIHEDETLEDLQLGGLVLIQKKHNFRFGMDAVLLADFAAIRPGDRVADLGTGTGILPVLLIGREKGKSFLGVEVQEEMAEMATRTMAMNGLEERVEIMRADVAELRSRIPGCAFDAAVCNPPYGMPGKSMVNQAASLTTSRHQGENTLRDFFQAAHHLLKGKGKLFLVYPAAQMFSLMTALKVARLEPKHFRLVYPDVLHPANLVLMEAVKDAKPLLQPMPPLIIHTESGDLTNELKSIYHMAEQTGV